MLSETRKVKSITNLINIEVYIEYKRSLLTLLRVTAWVRRFIYNCRAKSNTGDRIHGQLARTEPKTF